jgi:hypothetical protein
MFLSLRQYLLEILISKFGCHYTNQINCTIKEKVKLMIHYADATYSLLRF